MGQWVIAQTIFFLTHSKSYYYFYAHLKIIYFFFIKLLMFGNLKDFLSPFEGYFLFNSLWRFFNETSFHSKSWGILHLHWKKHSLVFQFSSVTRLCLTLCNPVNRSMPGLPVRHQLLEFTQTHVHWVGDAIQPSHSLSSPSPPALNLSQHQGLFIWVSCSHQVAKVLVVTSSKTVPYL